MVHVSRGKKDCPSHVDSLREEPLTPSLSFSLSLSLSLSLCCSFELPRGAESLNLCAEKKNKRGIIGLPFGPKRAGRSKIASRI